jgi:hypothetical protein
LAEVAEADVYAARLMLFCSPSLHEIDPTWWSKLPATAGPSPEHDILLLFELKRIRREYVPPVTFVIEAAEDYWLGAFAPILYQTWAFIWPHAIIRCIQKRSVLHPTLPEQLQQRDIISTSVVSLGICRFSGNRLQILCGLYTVARRGMVTTERVYTPGSLRS